MIFNGNSRNSRNSKKRRAVATGLWSELQAQNARPTLKGRGAERPPDLVLLALGFLEFMEFLEFIALLLISTVFYEDFDRILRRF